MPGHRLGGDVGERSFDHDPVGAFGERAAQDNVQRLGGSGHASTRPSAPTAVRAAGRPGD